MRPMSPPEFTNGTGTVLTAEKRVAVAGTQTDENNEENETNARKARHKASMPKDLAVGAPGRSGRNRRTGAI